MAGWNRIHLSRSLFLVALLTPGMAAPLSAEAGTPTPPLFVQMKGTPAHQPDSAAIPLDLVRARYEIEVFGSLALGTLIQEFRNESGQDLMAGYLFRGTGQLVADSLDFSIEGGPIHPESAPPEDGASPKSGAKAQSPKPFAEKRGPRVLVEADQRIAVRVHFRQHLAMNDDKVQLLLPALTLEEPAPPHRGPGRAQRRPREVDGQVRSSAPAPSVPIQANIYHDEVLPLVESATHEISTDFEGDLTRVSLAGAGLEQGHFELSFALGSEREPRLLVYAGPEGDGVRDLALVFAPPSDPWEGMARPKQILFVLDRSGSMTNHKLDQARIALLQCVDRLGPDDLYNVVAFSREFASLSEGPVSPLHLPPDQAKLWLDALEAEGETRMLPALDDAFQQLDSESHHRMVVIVSDGIVADEKHVLKFLDQKLGAARLFVIGVGMDLREETLQQMAAFGRGTVALARHPEDIEPALSGLFRSVSLPLAWNLEFDWEGMTLESLRPERLPDLYAGRTMTALARVQGPLPSEILLTGVTVDGAQTWYGPVKFMEEEGALRDLPALRDAADPQQSPGNRKKAAQ